MVDITSVHDMKYGEWKVLSFFWGFVLFSHDL